MGLHLHARLPEDPHGRVPLLLVTLEHTEEQEDHVGLHGLGELPSDDDTLVAGSWAPYPNHAHLRQPAQNGGRNHEHQVLRLAALLHQDNLYHPIARRES